MSGAGKLQSPLVNALNQLDSNQDRWCTPSILEEQHRIEDEYNDVSVSTRSFGSLLEHDGRFGDAEKFAAQTYGADRTFLSPHGSTGANAIALRMLALESRDALVLLARNVHHSIINALKMFSIDFRFLPKPHYDAHFEAILPPKIEDVLVGLEHYPETLAVIYTSPTYEGLTADTSGITSAVNERYPDVIVVVDEAWGGHLEFHDGLPKAAMRSGADIVVQSTHKMAGSLQQGALIHWSERRVDSPTMEEAYREYVTTSPSYHLLGSVDAALRLLSANGNAYLDRSIKRSDTLRAALEVLPDLDIIGAERLKQYPRTRLDLTKTTLGLSRYRITGFKLAEMLAAKGIIVERAGLNSLMFLTTFQLPDDAEARAANAIIESLERKALKQVRTPPGDPFAAPGNIQKMRPYEVVRYAKYLSHEVPLQDAVGCIAAESVELYPPGIPLILEGYEVTPDAVAYLQSSLKEHAHLVARDPKLRTLRVLGSNSRDG